MCGVYTTGVLMYEPRSSTFLTGGGRPGFQKARYPTGRDGSVMLTAATTTLTDSPLKEKGSDVVSVPQHVIQPMSVDDSNVPIVTRPTRLRLAV